ncbi:hypothetical protein JA33_245 [Dickeya phage vB_DsoM_JA33]|uniref:Uncharacterized protein n=3 Tax=Salmondvirus JA11 TaxID=2734141 RepID=A0A384ZWM2_9CAUD|nr:hypothetical protein HOU32_gp244 [Dickeya phage vB_DsoM_JA11]AXG66648.1 hypothetical protein JA13_245 [Dickeya phage vB_DsoM_JA13]AXG67619.1 hypothetical protein JA33_245 [Dickeya phage vB_DsoM_JA33]AYD80049.1 hypothetical protein JA11_244 [Dickeya phage vB_DsoM_JA11]
MTQVTKKRYCPETGVELREALGIPRVVIVCHMIERERGSGKRPDGFVYCESKENLQKFSEFIYQQKVSSRGECYSEILNTELVQVSEEYLKELSKHRDDLHRPWIWENSSKHNVIV